MGRITLCRGVWNLRRIDLVVLRSKEFELNFKRTTYSPFDIANHLLQRMVFMLVVFNPEDILLNYIE
jgi:hypothetical protein